MEKLLDEIKRQHPNLAKQAERYPLKAIRLFCLECVGGVNSEVRRCSVEDCPLFRFRFGMGLNDKRNSLSV